MVRNIISYEIYVLVAWETTTRGFPDPKSFQICFGIQARMVESQYLLIGSMLGPDKELKIVFLLVESCGIANCKLFAESLIQSYYEERHKLGDVEIPQSEQRVQVSCALAGFPFFVAVWFGCIDASQLTEPNFPFLYITRLGNAFTHLYDKSWTQFKGRRFPLGNPSLS